MSYNWRMRQRGKVAAISAWTLVLVAVTALAACNETTTLTVEELMSPETCRTCHPKHYDEWKSSMHAYASDDEVFIALNARAQADTGGEVGSLCAKCHAPMAFALGLTVDGTNIRDVPQWARGVTCYFCHNTVEVNGTHNNPLKLAMDTTMRGGLYDVVENSAHGSAFSDLLAGDSDGSSQMCGACHDVVTPLGVKTETTFIEWQASLFGQPGRSHLSCAECHMTPRTDYVAEGAGIGAPLREFGRRDHLFAGADVALTPWPGKDVQRDAIETKLANTLLPRLCVTPLNGGEISVRLDNTGAGHTWPSGAVHDRRAWVTVRAFDADDQVVFESGVVGEAQDPEDLADPYLWQIGNENYGVDDEPVTFSWEIARIVNNRLPPIVTTDPNDPRFDHSVTRAYPVPGLIGQIERVEMMVSIRPFPFRVFDELAGSGHMDPELAVDLKAALPTFELAGTKLVWTAAAADAGGCVKP